jgi:outer membrane lipoprotein SlyB
MDLYILEYNNYYNRILKKENSLAEYLPHSVYTILNANFNPADGVHTEHVFGVSVLDLTPYNGAGDYIVVTDNGKINSRWFILDEERILGGQYKLRLQRDVLVDYYNEITNADLFIEKGNINSLNNPLLFNKEAMTFNQIKKEETPIKDKSGCAWIVGYYSKNIAALEGTVYEPKTDETGVEDIQMPIETWPFYQYTNLSPENNVMYTYPTEGTYNLYAITEGTSRETAQFSWSVFDYNETVTVSPKLVDDVNVGITYKAEGLTTPLHDAARALGHYLGGRYTPRYNVNKENAPLLQDLITSQKVLSTQETNEILNLVGKTIKDSNGRYFSINLSAQTIGTVEGLVGGVAKNRIMTAVENCPSFTITNRNNLALAVKVIAACETYQIYLSEIEEIELKYNITPELPTNDAPYNVFAIPVGGTVTLPNNSTITTTQDIAIRTAMAIQAQQGSNLYDIQLLPYCPIQNLNLTDAQQYSAIMAGDTVKGIILNVPQSKFNFTIDFIKNCATNAINRKINDACDKWRLTSPNFSNYFDFSLEKNYGIKYIDVDCHYKPYTPYIHINPDFSGLYGYDDNSPRGLVLGGEFSLSQISDKWVEFQIQNKNFQQIFDRQIQNMEVQHDVQRTRDIFGAVTGTVSGATSGAAAGGMAGGPWGAIAGAVAGGTASAVGGVLDVQLNERLRAEAIDFTKDNFGYQLGNIQALPQTLSKVTAFNNNNKIFPILEKYSCTDIEKIALANKLKFNGMTIMVIGKLNEYINTWTWGNITCDRTYIKAKLIRINNIPDNYHIVNVIAKELNQGVFI